MNHDDQNDAPEVEAFALSIVEGNEQPLLAFQTLGRRYRRKTPYPKPRPYDRAKEKGEYGDPAELQAVFDSRAAYFQENPKPETLQEVATDSRDLMSVLKDFPGAHDFVLEMETVRMKSVDRLQSLKQAQNRVEPLLQQLGQARVELQELSRRAEAGEIEAGELQKQLQKTTSKLEKAERKALSLRRQLDDTDGIIKDRFSLEEISAELGLEENTISTYIGQMRRADADKPEAERRIKTPKYGHLTRPEVNHVRDFADSKAKRLKARNSRD
jgi:chromosome segregation ATPase